MIQELESGTFFKRRSRIAAEDTLVCLERSN